MSEKPLKKFQSTNKHKSPELVENSSKYYIINKNFGNPQKEYENKNSITEKNSKYTENLNTNQFIKEKKGTNSKYLAERMQTQFKSSSAQMNSKKFEQREENENCIKKFDAFPEQEKKSKKMVKGEGYLGNKIQQNDDIKKTTKLHQKEIKEEDADLEISDSNVYKMKKISEKNDEHIYENSKKNPNVDNNYYKNNTKIEYFDIDPENINKNKKSNLEEDDYQNKVDRTKIQYNKPSNKNEKLIQGSKEFFEDLKKLKKELIDNEPSGSKQTTKENNILSKENKDLKKQLRDTIERYDQKLEEEINKIKLLEKKLKQIENPRNEESSQITELINENKKLKNRLEKNQNTNEEIQTKSKI